VSIKITDLETLDIRFPTSLELDGSDAMNPDPDYSAAYLILKTSRPDLEGHASVFTIGRGNDVQVAAIAALREFVVGRDLTAIESAPGDFYRELTYESQFRWLGPEKGMMHMAIGAVVNAVWDLLAKMSGKPLWKLLSDLSPEQVVELVDFRYLTDVLTKEQALEHLRVASEGKQQREKQLLTDGYPAYTTSPGWLGYSDEKLQSLAKKAMEEGFGQIKLKVGADLDDDLRRLAAARQVCGPDFPIAIDANQRWDVEEAITWIKALEKFDLAWVEEPTSPDDLIGHSKIAEAIHPIPVATGEHLANRVLAKQLLTLRGASVLQIDASRVAGVNEIITLLLLAHHFKVRVCPHAGGVGLCEAVQHFSMFDFIAISGTMDNRFIEYVDHLHEHYLEPVHLIQGRYVPPKLPGNSQQMHKASMDAFLYPTGPVWTKLREEKG